MIKQGTKWIMKTLTDVWSNQENGVVHSYNYFEDEDGTWIYNIDFHLNHCFASVQLKFNKRVPIKQAMSKARKIFNNTQYVEQPMWTD